MYITSQTIPIEITNRITVTIDLTLANMIVQHSVCYGPRMEAHPLPFGSLFCSSQRPPRHSDMIIDNEGCTPKFFLKKKE